MRIRKILGKAAFLVMLNAALGGVPAYAQDSSSSQRPSKPSRAEAKDLDVTMDVVPAGSNVEESVGHKIEIGGNQKPTQGADRHGRNSEEHKQDERQSQSEIQQEAHDEAQQDVRQESEQAQQQNESKEGSSGPP